MVHKCSFCPVLDPGQLPGLGQADFVRIRGNPTLKGGIDLLCQGRTLDHKAQFGVELGRPRIEVERADEDPSMIYRKGLGMQARGRTRCEPSALVSLFCAGWSV